MQATKSVEKLSANNLMLILMLVSFLIVGTTFLVAKTLIVGLIRDTKVLNAENKANDNLDKNLKSAPELVNSYQLLGTKADVIADALPTDSNFPGLIVALENIASDSTIALKSVAPAFIAGTQDTTGTGTVSTTNATSGKTGSIDPPKPAVYSFTVAFDGSYTSLQKMLADLELYDRPMRVQSMKLSGSGSALSGTVDVQTFYQNKATLPLATETIK